MTRETFQRIALALAVVTMMGIVMPVGAAPAALKQIMVAQGIEPWTLDSGQVTAQAIVNVTAHVLESMLEYDPQFKMRGHLAQSWSRTGPTTWEYRLRPNIKFSNGQALTAEDVKFSFDRVMAEASKSQRKGETRYIKSVTTAGANVVRFETNVPIPYFDLYQLKFPIVPKAYVQQIGEERFATQPIGTGPFVLKEWVKDERIVLDANPNYWGEKPKVDRIVFRTVPDVSARVAALLSSQTDIVVDLQPVSKDRVRARPTLQIVESPSMRNMFIMYDVLNNTPLRDRRVRQALNFAINKDELIRTVLGGYGKALQGQVVTNLYRDFNPNLQPYPYDLARARALLQEAGFPQGFEIRMQSPNGRYMLDKEMAQAVAGQLQQAGVRVRVDVLEWGVYTREQYSYSGGPLFYIGYATEPDTARMLSVFHGKHPNSYYRVPAFDQMVEAAESEGDAARRQTLVRRALEYFREEAPILFLHQQVDLFGLNRRLRGWVPFPDQRIRLNEVDVTR
ncbi:MAG: hypothetical protein FJX78_04270 [Armatimonadetes bacterium]|nr:hypothetical protein [Armatimonadota bacterium]